VIRRNGIPRDTTDFESSSVVPLGASDLRRRPASFGSKLFPRWVALLDLVAGALAVVGGILQVAALSRAGPLFDVADAVTGVGAISFWIWILITSIMLWRHTQDIAKGRPAQ